VRCAGILFVCHMLRRTVSSHAPQNRGANSAKGERPKSNVRACAQLTVMRALWYCHTVDAVRKTIREAARRDAVVGGHQWQLISMRCWLMRR
jgi:hypothetical protein